MRYFLSFILLLSFSTIKANLTVNGSAYQPCVVTPEASSGLEAIYVIYDTHGVSLSYPSQGDASAVKWTKFSSLGGAYGEEVNATVTGNLSTITLSDGDMGYIVEDNGRQHCYWIVNYADHYCHLNSVSLATEESDCAMLALRIDGQADRITYYTINGIPRELSRDIKIDYYNLRWDSESNSYIQEETTTYVTSVSRLMRVTTSLCETAYTLSGDRFLSEWNLTEEISTAIIPPMAVEAHTTATQTERENNNEIADSSSDLGGSAPVEITFDAVTSDGGIFKEWQISRFADFDIIDLRFNEESFTYTFRENGTLYVRYMTADASGSCEFYGDTYQVDIGESRLLCPNAFSPGASEGINDEWKVSYKSIIDFQCHIFNRWGIELFSTTNPAVGWDGRYNGKIVPSGVYFYVIKATGADGKKYSLSGDINIIHHNKRNESANYPTE